MDIQALKSQAFGITRSIDNVGRIVIPAEIREKLEMSIGDKVEIFAVKWGILLIKTEDTEPGENE